MGYEVDTNILETYAKRLLDGPPEPTEKFFGTVETIEKDFNDVAASIKEKKSDQQPVTHVSLVVTSSKTDSDKDAEFKRVGRKKRKSPSTPALVPSPKKTRTLRKKEHAMKEPSGPKKKIAQKELTPKISDTLFLTKLVNKLTQDAKSIQEIDELIAEANITIFISGHRKMIALECKVDHIIGSIVKLDTLSKFISANMQSLDKINKKTIQEKIDKEKEVFFRKIIKECTQQIDTLLPALNSTILEYKELYREACKSHQLTEDIDDQIRKNQKEIDDIADNIIGPSELTSVIEHEMATHEKKIENLEKEKARLKMKARELKNKLGPRLDNLITHQNALSKAKIQGDRTLEHKMHYLTGMIRQIETIITDNTKFMQGLNLVLADIFQIVHNRLQGSK
ncbi:uncharacterized protein LOC131045433 [Cryptomeria japonica]|uniref:uncharacterized protein LOC131045433 n=1 Tax=Cryptomeria japonica TaxID=3369 RepID=UPI0027DA75B4|nr:uncharacterized protein LOC131045433 [Cryptomeria japonica]